MKKSKNIIVWRFDRKEKFWFLVPDNKEKYNCDFFVALRNSLEAWNGDKVEALEIKWRWWKSREARLLKIIEKWVKNSFCFSNFDDKKTTKKDISINNSHKQFNSNNIEKKQDENTIVWIYSQWKWDFWFIDVEWIEKWYFVFAQNKNWALDWDKVEAFVKVFKWKQEAEIIKVIERKQELIVWEYLPGKWNNFWFVIPNNPQIKNDIFVAGKKSMDAKKWDIVWVHVTNWIWKNPEWEIKEILWKKWDKKLDVLSLIVEWWARIKFSDEVLRFAEKVGNNVKNDRADLTNIFTFTIDWEDAKDLDDAISIEKLWPPPNTLLSKAGEVYETWYKLYVHIADVAEYVTEKNPLDIEAYKRATSVYLVDRVIPMLPEKLSNDLCSLNANTEKLTLTCEMIIWNNWKIKSQKVYESVIKSDFRLTYREVDEILNSKIKNDDELLFWWKITSELINILQIANELKLKITKYRNSTWVLNFDFPETKIILDENENPVNIKEYPRYDSNKLIEEFMISANEAVSSEFSDIPFLYRIHEEPKEDSIASLQETLNLFWVKFEFKKADTKEFDKLLEMISKLEEWSRMFLEKTILRTLSKAVYSKENFGHFGLWLSFYSHFTSPIRRYPDLQIHRIIKEKIHNKLDKNRIIHYKEILDEVAKHTSDKERRAEKLEYKVRDYYIVKYYKNRIGEEFDWIISWVIPKWFFVALVDTAEWFVEMNNSQYMDVLKEHMDLITGKKYRLWNKVRVKLVEADELLLRLNFEIV